MRRVFETCAYVSEVSVPHFDKPCQHFSACAGVEHSGQMLLINTTYAVASKMLFLPAAEPYYIFHLFVFSLCERKNDKSGALWANRKVPERSPQAKITWN